jgi:hypothetical protein
MTLWPYLARRIARRAPQRLKLKPSVGRYLTVYDGVL